MNAPPPPLKINEFDYGKFLGAFTSGEVADWIAAALDMLHPHLAVERVISAFKAGLLEPGGEAARRVVESLILEGRAAVQSLTNRLIRASVTPATWFGGVMKDVAIRSTAAALGLRGRAKLRKQEAQALADAVTMQRAFLSRFLDQIRSGVQELGEGALFRARQYAESAWGTAWKVVVAGAELDGAQLVKRILGVADHCKPCLRLAAKGFIPIADLTPIGNTPCRVFCHCRLII